MAQIATTCARTTAKIVPPGTGIRTPSVTSTTTTLRDKPIPLRQRQEPPTALAFGLNVWPTDKRPILDTCQNRILRCKQIAPIVHACQQQRTRTMSDFKHAKVIAIVNHKGGCGKTTTTINLAAEFARQGNRVLVVDLDPQANASLHIGKLHPSNVEVSAAELLTGDHSLLAQAVQEHTTIDGVCLISGSLALGKAEDELKDFSPRPNEELRSKLLPADEVFDTILIDCPPSLKLLASNALAAATHVIVPIEAGDQYGLYGAEDLLKKVTQIRRINPTLEMLGALLIKYDDRQTICKLLAGQAEQTFGRLLPERISQGTAVRQAVVMKTSAHSVDRASKPARQFRALATALAKMLQLRVQDETLAEGAEA